MLGADDVYGADFIFEVELFVLVVVDVLPLSYVVAPPVYPPSIAVFEPLVFVCVEPALATVADINVIQKITKTLYTSFFISFFSYPD
jgi:hypothetical protein